MFADSEGCWVWFRSVKGVLAYFFLLCFDRFRHACMPIELATTLCLSLDYMYCVVSDVVSINFFRIDVGLI